MDKLPILLLLIVSLVAALHVTDISHCPALAIRALGPRDITDLRPGDIKIFGALGDSVLAGYGVNNINPGIFGLLNTTSLTEYRGLNYLLGGDAKAVTIANFMKHYNSQIHGSSIGFHELRRMQKGKPNLYLPQVDNLNAAKSSAKAVDLGFEMDYLVKTLKETSKTGDILLDHWKMITIHIGGNDLCSSCKPEFSNITSAEAYGGYVEEAVVRIKNHFPNNTLVNLVGTLNMKDIHQTALENPEYCSNRSLFRPCSCLYTVENPDVITKLASDYDSQLQLIARKYAAKPNSTFGVIFTPLPANLTSAPVEVLSNIDCFHPSLVGHKWFAKAIWNRFFIRNEFKPSIIQFNDSEKIYCPTENDRIQVL